ncbi:hypothetical protein ABZ281_34350 [Streptomyces sp. NPDC006265]|uniref:hypothetical protein n=1 Tax=Streptomyces sp. NPDC006265 TaxID=3156740 RepID=UPI0033A1C1DF
MATAQTGDSRLEEFLADPETAALDLTTAAARCTKALGVPHSVVYPAEFQQRRLVPLTDVTASLLVDDSLAGWTYRTQSLRVTDSESGGMTAWLPLVDGAERLGVLAVARARADAGRPAQRPGPRHADRHDDHVQPGVRGLLRPAHAHAPDAAARRDAAGLPAARTIGTAHVVSTAVLEPAYEIGGDAFDHSLTETTLHATVLDAMGHDLAPGLTTAVSLAACRNARRTGADLPELVQCVDDAPASGSPTRSARASWPNWTWPRACCGGPTAVIPPRS